MLLQTSFVHLYFVSKVDKNRNMPRPSGLRKTGGRAKGTLNKRTSLLANDLEERGFSLPDELIKNYRSLDPDKQAAFLLKMMDFFYIKPTQKDGVDFSSKPQSHSSSRYYTDHKGVPMMEAVITHPDGQVVRFEIPDNGSTVDSPLRKQ